MTKPIYMIISNQDPTAFPTMAEAIKDLGIDETGEIYEIFTDEDRSRLVTEDCAYYWLGYAREMGHTVVPAIFHRWLGVRVNEDPDDRWASKADYQRDLRNAGI